WRRTVAHPDRARSAAAARTTRPPRRRPPIVSAVVMTDSSLKSVSGSQLVGDGQASDPLAGRGKDCIAQRRRERWDARLPDAAGRRIALDDVHARLARRHVQARDLKVVEVVLLG